MRSKNAQTPKEDNSESQLKKEISLIMHRKISDLSQDLSQEEKQKLEEILEGVDQG